MVDAKIKRLRVPLYSCLKFSDFLIWAFSFDSIFKPTLIRSLIVFHEGCPYGISLNVFCHEWGVRKANKFLHQLFGSFSTMRTIFWLGFFFLVSSTLGLYWQDLSHVDVIKPNVVSNGDKPSFVTTQEKNQKKVTKHFILKLLLLKKIAEARNGIRNSNSNYPSPFTSFF